MRAYVRLLLPDDQVVDLCPGDLIGRLWTAALRIDDPRVSEAHALVSLRGAELKLLALRGVMAVEGRRVADVVLEEGLRVSLAKDLHLEVVEVEIPETALALRLPGMPPQILLSSVYSVVDKPALSLEPRYAPRALAHVWSTGEGWHGRTPGAESVLLVPGEVQVLGGLELEVVEVPVRQAGAAETRAAGALHKPMRIIAQYDTVHVHREGEPVVTLNGISARIVSELVGFAGPTDWELVARQIWRDEAERFLLRRKWDVNLARLRRKLREGRLRPDLVMADGSGHFELLLHPGDEVEDRT